MTGWRLGYLAAPKEVAKATDKMQGQFTSGASSFGQKAAEIALESPLDETWKMRDEFRKRRDLIISLLQQIPDIKTNIPEGAFYIFPNVSAYFGKQTQSGKVIKDADELCEYILDTAYVALVSGSAFGDDNCIRISYAASEAEIKEACARIQKSLADLL